MLDATVDDATQLQQRAADLGLPAYLGGGIAGESGADAALGVVHVQIWDVIQQIHIALEVRLDGAHIPPVAVEAVAVDLARRIGDERRGDIAAEVVLAFVPLRILDQRLDEDFLIEDVDTHGDEVRAWLLRLFIEVDDEVLVVEEERAEAAGLVPGHGTDWNGDVGALSAMEGDEFVVGHLVDVVTCQEQDLLRARFLHVVEVLVDGVGSALIPV